MAEASQALTESEGGGRAIAERGSAGRTGAGTAGRIPGMDQLEGLFGGRQNVMRLGLAVVLLFTVAAGVLLYLWAQEPSYRTLFSELDDQDAAAVIEQLEEQGIPYRLDERTGAVRVPSDQVHPARLQLAAEGLPRGTGFGFEMLQEDSAFGTSEFMEGARFDRALETELARSIGTLRQVDAARVHLALPRESVFVRDRRQPRASVVVNLAQGRRLNDEQVDAIVHMVASSVPDLAHENVSVVDERGRLLTRDEGRGLASTAGQFQYKTQVEETYVRRIEDLLAPLVGRNRVRAQVNASLDFSEQQRTEELYDPDSRVIRSEALQGRRTQQGADAAMGVPGALTNQPPGAGQLDGEEAPENPPPVDISSSETRNYEISRTLRQVRDPIGSIQRVSVAVVVDERITTDEEGNTVREPLSDEEMDRINALVQEAVGFDAARGDSVNVVNAAFLEEEPVEAMPPVPLLEREWVRELIRFAIAALAFIALLLFVVRPMIKGMQRQRDQALRAPASEEQARLAQQGGGGGAAQLAGPDANEQALLAGVQHKPYEAKLEAAKKLVNDEPELAANVIKSWLAEDDGKR
ncbi:flagellar basal-body MS-ring/collar protein FliF [Alkalilimnicola ehrlichii MLHE-1]|uniref:Flagellar M-ring protein n=1 Tax=Alkalilimnicola ehrlichii (strain ATCC BAA-1101 / DSM 17681 / MLHE-1) TaxID=187272 RepID=Q0AAS4_ALKEH|nr:flagellar basal-body MS-ring/collar protein FliF [Alkalilimnicola ehrlichii]ABI56063.1 flagellar M-ring protein FliF [Alkalilimnicola ehrlichii MLHE-1]